MGPAGAGAVVLLGVRWGYQTRLQLLHSALVFCCFGMAGALQSPVMLAGVAVPLTGGLDGAGWALGYRGVLLHIHVAFLGSCIAVLVKLAPCILHRPAVFGCLVCCW